MQIYIRCPQHSDNEIGLIRGKFSFYGNGNGEKEKKPTRKSTQWIDV